MKEYIQIGKTKKPFGLTGELKVDIEEAFLEDFLLAKILFLRIKGKPVPYFVEGIQVKGMPLLKLEDVDNKETAVKIGGSDILLREEDILPEEQRQLEVEETIEFARLKGFSIHDLNLGPIGKIEAIEEFPQQEMAIVSYKEKETMIPLNEGLIEEIDYEKRIVKMDLPEGLLKL